MKSFQIAPYGTIWTINFYHILHEVDANIWKVWKFNRSVEFELYCFTLSLSQDNVPSEIRDEIVEKFSQGVTFTEKQVKDMVAEHKQRIAELEKQIPSEGASWDP